MSERQRIEAAPAPAHVPNPTPASIPSMDDMPPPPSYEEVNGVPTSPMQNGSTDSMGYFLGEVHNLLILMCLKSYIIFFILFQLLFCFQNKQVMYPYQAESDVELTLSIGDYVVVRKVCNPNFYFFASASLAN